MVIFLSSALLGVSFICSGGNVVCCCCGCSGCSPSAKAGTDLKRNAMTRATRTRVIMKALYVRSAAETIQNRPAFQRYFSAASIARGENFAHFTFDPEGN